MVEQTQAHAQEASSTYRRFPPHINKAVCHFSDSVQHLKACSKSAVHQRYFMLTGGLLGRYKQPNGGLLGLAAGIMAVMATASLANLVLWGSKLGAGPSLAWASVGALTTWLIWRYQVCMTGKHLAMSDVAYAHPLHGAPEP